MDLGLGKIITTDQQRDAIHVAVIPVTAAEKLRPGDRVDANGGSEGEAVGIVDPFLATGPRKGQRFWLFLFPNTVEAIRHEWSHPAFPTDARAMRPAERGPAVEWLENFAAEIGIDYAEMMRAAEDYQRTGERLTQYGSQGWQDGVYGIEEKFWGHYAAVTGQAVTDRGGNPFSCSC